MNINSKNINALVDGFNQVIEDIERLTYYEVGHGAVNYTSPYRFSYEYNSDCRCHPNYVTRDIPFDRIKSWLDFTNEIRKEDVCKCVCESDYKKWLKSNPNKMKDE